MLIVKMGVVYSTNQTYAEEISSEDEDYLPCKNHCDPHPKVQERMEPSNFTTDAVGKSAEIQQDSHVFQVSDHRVTVENVAQIEEGLDFYEKVSLVYLLYDDAEIALQHLIQLQQGAQIDVLVEWAKFSTKSDNWQGKLLEALCIIQNYELVCKLGYNKTEGQGRFLPLNENTSLFIDLIKKKLYRISENFTNELTRKFVEIIRHDFEVKNIPFRQFDPRYLEMYLLHWTTIKYISHTDLTNLYKALKVMEMYEVADSLKSLTPSYTLKTSERHKTLSDDKMSNVEEAAGTGSRHNVNNEYLEIGTTPERSLSSVSSAAGSSIQQDRIRKSSYEDKSYPINPEHPGVCLIINQEVFYTEFEKSLQHLLPATNKQLENREGTNIDRDRLQYTFNKFGFTVIVVNNRDHYEMIDDIKMAINMVTNHSSLTICILSHGLEGKVYGVNSIPVEVREIQKLMCKTNVANLKRKPKILILQSCQGTQCQQVTEEDDDDEAEDLQTDGPGAAAVPRTADMLVFWATVPGYGAVRDKKRGAWFIQSLCSAILQNAEKMHFEDICTLVKQEVIDKRWETKKESRAMVPIKESTLSRFFFLPPMISKD